MVLPARYAERSVSPGVAWKDTASDACVMEPALRQPRPVASGPPKPAVQPHRCVELPAKGAEQSVAPRVTWRDAAADVCAMEPALQHPRLAVSDPPMPAVQPLRCVELPAKGAEQSALPRVAWQDVTSDVCAMGPALQYPRPVISNQPKPAVQSR